MKRSKPIHRILAIILSLALLAGMPAHALEEGGRAHTHDAICGYAEGADCGYAHEMDSGPTGGEDAPPPENPTEEPLCASTEDCTLPDEHEGACSAPLTAYEHTRSAESDTLAALNGAIQAADGTAEYPTEIVIAKDGITVGSTITIDGKHVKLTGGTLTKDSALKNDALITVKKGGSLTLQDIYCYKERKAR